MTGEGSTVPTDEELASGTHARLMTAVRGARAQLEVVGSAAETLRTLPPAAVTILRDLGVFWLKTPRALGGTPIEPLQFADVIEELAYCEASSAWAAMIGAGSTGLAAGWLSEEGAKEVFLGHESPPIVAGQPQPRGIGRRVEGGYQVSGQWSFASGIRHADWVLGAFHVEGEDDGTFTAFVVPKAEVTVVDNWYVAGLQGTGSADFLLNDVFIPAEHAYDRTTPLAWSPEPLFQQDVRVFVSNEVPAFCVGTALRAIDDMVELAGGTTRGFSGAPLSERPVFQREVGVAQVRVRAAQLLYRDAVGEAWEAARRGAELSAAQRLAPAAAHVYVTDTCAEVVSGLFRYGGGRVLSSSHPMQRHLRNLLAARQHVAATEEHYETAGRERLGRPARTR